MTKNRCLRNVLAKSKKAALVIVEDVLAILPTRKDWTHRAKREERPVKTKL